MGMFASPNRAAIMNSLPKEHRGAGGAMNQTFQNSAQVLSIGIFFTLLIVGLAATLPQTMSAGLQAHGVDPATAQRVGALPPVSILFAAFLGYNPIQSLLGPDALHALSPANQAAVTGPGFFPQLISQPVPGRPAHGVQVRDHRLPGRGRRLAAARRALPLRRGGARHTTRGDPCALSGSDSRRSGSRRVTSRSSSTRSETCRRPPRAGCGSTTRRWRT